ncbi:MAG TPA: beta-eliminating lyase-related protein, partial [Nitriliruptorales bacterium]
GARVWHAIVADGHAPTVYGEVADAMCFCISKGLGAPVGSVLLGTAAFVDEARTWRRRLGGAMRQAGVLAAAGIHALDHNVDRLDEDHDNARRLAAEIASVAPNAVDPSDVATNLVYVRTGGRHAASVADAVADQGVLVLALSPDRLRAVTHLDVDRDACERAGKVIGAAVAAAAGWS